MCQTCEKWNEKRMNVYEKHEMEKKRRKENVKQKTIYYVLGYNYCVCINM